MDVVARMENDDDDVRGSLKIKSGRPQNLTCSLFPLSHSLLGCELNFYGNLLPGRDKRSSREMDIIHYMTIKRFVV